MIFFEALLNAMPMPVFFKDVEGHYLHANQAYLDFTGFTRDKLIGATVYDLYSKEFADLYHQADLELMKSPTEKWVYQSQGRDKENVVRDLVIYRAMVRDPENQLLGTLGVVMDITERIRAENDVKKGQELLQNVFDGIPESLGLLDINGDILMCNQTLARRLGFTPDQIIGRHALEAFPPEIREMRNRNAHEAIRTKKPFFAEEQRGHVYLQTSYYPMMNAEGEVTALIVFGSDISNKKQLEVEKEHVQHQLIHSEKLASIGTLAAGIAHEINNPMTVIRTYLEIVRDHLQDPEMLELTTRAASAAQRISKIVSGLRVYARPDNEEMRPINANHVIRDTLSMFENIYAQQGITLRIQLSAESISIFGNAGKLQQILVILLTNAADAVAGQSVQMVTLASENRSNELILSVSDTGHGIPEELRPKIFDPFFTTKDIGKGTGLGLYIAHGLIQSMKGRVDVTSSLEGGACFVLYFPLINKNTVDP